VRIQDKEAMILVKTEAGQRVFKDRSVRLTPRQRSAFILFDGKRSVDEVLAAGMGIARPDIEQMIELGLLEQVAGAETAAAAGGASPVAQQPQAAVASSPSSVAPDVPGLMQPAVGRSAQQRYQDAYAVATKLTAGLGLRGFRLNLAVEAAGTYEQLAALAPKIRAAVGDEKAAALEQALAA
jgi:hypothetical protein